MFVLKTISVFIITFYILYALVLCDSNLTVDHGVVKMIRPDDRDFRAGVMIAVFCNSGYRRVGEQDTLTCQLDGAWSSPTPRCEKVYGK